MQPFNNWPIERKPEKVLIERGPTQWGLSIFAPLCRASRVECDNLSMKALVAHSLIGARSK